MFILDWSRFFAEPNWFHAHSQHLRFLSMITRYRTKKSSHFLCRQIDQKSYLEFRAKCRWCALHLLCILIFHAFLFRSVQLWFEELFWCFFSKSIRARILLTKYYLGIIQKTEFKCGSLVGFSIQIRTFLSEIFLEFFKMAKYDILSDRKATTSSTTTFQ